MPMCEWLREGLSCDAAVGIEGICHGRIRVDPKARLRRQKIQIKNIY